MVNDKLLMVNGKGFSERTIREIRQFYLTFPEVNIRHSLSAELTNQKGSTLWSQLSTLHFKAILTVNNIPMVNDKLLMVNKTALDYTIDELLKVLK
jgi:hypothetical protein